jgi:hypothetical protein
MRDAYSLAASQGWEKLAGGMALRYGGCFLGG